MVTTVHGRSDAALITKPPSASVLIVMTTEAERPAVLEPGFKFIASAAPPAPGPPFRRPDSHDGKGASDIEPSHACHSKARQPWGKSVDLGGRRIIRSEEHTS